MYRIDELAVCFGVAITGDQQTATSQNQAVANWKAITWVEYAEPKTSRPPARLVWARTNCRALHQSFTFLRTRHVRES